MRKPSPALVVAILALVVAVAGTGYAALKLPKNSVGAKQIKKNAVNSRKVKNRSLLKTDFKKGQLPAGKTGPTGPQGPVGRSALTPLQTGDVLRGVAGIDFRAAGANNVHGTFISLQLPTTTALTTDKVLIDGRTETSDQCKGTVEDPTAPPGYVCIYRLEEVNVDVADMIGATPEGNPTHFGFVIELESLAAGTTRLQTVWAYTEP